MSYCIKCGKQNSDTAKFCTGCGGILSNKTVIPVPDIQSVNKGKTNRTIIISVGILVIATFVYFIFINKQKKTDKDLTNDIKTDTTVTQITTVTSSEPVPLKPSSKETQMTISQNEVEIISRKLDEFYEYETKEDIPSLFSYYRFPLDRYYQLYNVSYERLHKMVVEAFNGKLYYHKIKINWNYSSVQKLSIGGFKAILSAEYTSASQSDNDRKTRNIHLTILMNNNYEITSIYPN